MIQINTQPYKITYEGSYYGLQFEYEVFDGDYDINWLDDCPENDDEAEEEIHEYCRKQILI